MPSLMDSPKVKKALMIRMFLNYRKRELAIAKKNTVARSLSREQLRTCREYYRRWFRLNPSFHEFYYEKTGIFDPRFIPNDIYFSYIDTYYNNGKYAAVLDNKCYYARMFGNLCRQPRVFAYRMNRIWFDEQMSPLSDEELIRRVSGAKELVVKKANDSCGGHGVHFVTGEGEEICAAFQKAVSQMPNDIVVQYPVRQHPALNKVHADSVNTIRVFSLYRKGQVKIYSTALRMGIGGARVDNGSSGGIVSGIEADGRLKPYAYTTKGEKFFTHPTSGVKFDEIVVPAYAEILEITKKLHPLIPDFRMVSWDFSVDDEGHPVMIEANLRSGGLIFHQLNNGPLFGDDTEEILDEVFGYYKKIFKLMLKI